MSCGESCFDLQPHLYPGQARDNSTGATVRTIGEIADINAAAAIFAAAASDGFVSSLEFDGRVNCTPIGAPLSFGVCFALENTEQSQIVL